MNVTDAVKLCDQLSKDIDPSSRAAAHGLLAETVFKTGSCSNAVYFNLEIEAYHPVHMHFEFRGRPRIPFASLKVHVVQCCGPIRDLGTEPIFFFISLRRSGQNGGAKIASCPSAGLLLNVHKRLLERSRDNFFVVYIQAF